MQNSSPEVPRRPEQVAARGALEPPAHLAELTPEQFSLWRHHPVTALVLGRFLPDYRTALERILLNLWLAGNLTLSQEQQFRGQLLATEFVGNLDLATLRAFYEIPEARAGLRGQGESR